jgi:hypothetical protein
MDKKTPAKEKSTDDSKKHRGSAEPKAKNGKAGPARSSSGARTGTQKSDGKDVENPT